MFRGANRPTRRRHRRRFGNTPTPPTPQPPTIQELMVPSIEMLTDAMSKTSMRWSFESSMTSDDTGGSQTNGANWGHCLPVYALAAMAGISTVLSGRTPAQKLLAQLIYWTEPSQDRMPVGDSGYKAQYEVMFVSTVAIAKLTPAVWNDPSLTTERKARLDLAMQGCLAGSAWCMSDANLWIGSFSTERTIMGFQTGRDANPNFSSPPKLIIQIVAGYMGRAAAQTFLSTFDRDAFSAACTAAGGLGKMALLFSQNWTTSLVDAVYGKSSGARTGPTKAQLETGIRGYVYNTWRVTEADAAAVFAEQLEYNFQKTIRIGPVGDPPGSWGGSPYGIIGASTQGQLRAVIDDTAAWAGMPNAGLVGGPFELDTINGGYTPNLRSSMSYVARGLGAVFAGMVALAAQGLHVGRAATLAEGLTRARRGVIHLRYVTRYGYRSYAKGGWNGTSWISNNETWNTTWALNGGYEVPCRWGLGDCLISALTGARVSTADLYPEG